MIYVCTHPQVVASKAEQSKSDFSISQFQISACSRQAVDVTVPARASVVGHDSDIRRHQHTKLQQNPSQTPETSNTFPSTPLPRSPPPFPRPPPLLPHAHLQHRRVPLSRKPRNGAQRARLPQLLYTRAVELARAVELQRQGLDVDAQREVGDAADARGGDDGGGPDVVLVFDFLDALLGS